MTTMKHPFATLVTEAFPAEGEASADRLQTAIQTKRKGSLKMTRRRVTVLCAAILLISASAVTAKVMIDRYVLYHNGEAIGTVTTDGESGAVEVNLTRDPQGASLEMRGESGQPAGQMIFVPDSTGEAKIRASK
jgi:hypothetical protein